MISAAVPQRQVRCDPGRGSVLRLPPAPGLHAVPLFGDTRTAACACPVAHALSWPFDVPNSIIVIDNDIDHGSTIQSVCLIYS